MYRVSFRCGMFFPDPKNPDGLPVSPLLVFNSSWPAEECSTAPDYDRYSIFCKNLVKQLLLIMYKNDFKILFSSHNSPTSCLWRIQASGRRTETREAPLVMTSAASSREMSRLLLLVARRVRSSRRVSRFPCSPMLVEMKPGRILVKTWLKNYWFMLNIFTFQDIITMRRFAAELQSTFLVKKLITNHFFIQPSWSPTLASTWILRLDDGNFKNTTHMIFSEHKFICVLIWI